MLKYELIPSQLLYEGTIKPENLFVPGILAEENITNTHDSNYWQQLKNLTLPLIFNKHQPDFVFYLAGVDVLATDKLGKLALTKNGCKQRDKLVFEACIKHKLGVQVSMDGGYSQDIKVIVDAHCNTFRVAADLFT